MAWMVKAARALSIAWASFWLFFFVVESLWWNSPPLVTMTWTGAGLLFLGIAWLARLRELTGGFLLASAGVTAAVAYVIWAPEGLPVWSRLLTTAVLGIPPIAAGVLFLANHTRH